MPPAIYPAPRVEEELLMNIDEHLLTKRDGKLEKHGKCAPARVREVYGRRSSSLEFVSTTSWASPCFYYFLVLVMRFYEKGRNDC